jgi:hypothetical protein
MKNRRPVCTVLGLSPNTNSNMEGFGLSLGTAVLAKTNNGARKKAKNNFMYFNYGEFLEALSSDIKEHENI